MWVASSCSGDVTVEAWTGEPGAPGATRVERGNCSTARARSAAPRSLQAPLGRAEIGSVRVSRTTAQCSREFTVDDITFSPVAQPDTEISPARRRSSRSADASFLFLGNQPDSRFDCSLDGAPSVAVPAAVRATPAWRAGAHTFTVAMRDRFGTPDATPAAYTWTVDLSPPPAAAARPAGSPRRRGRRRRRRRARQLPGGRERRRRPTRTPTASATPARPAPSGALTPVDGRARRRRGAQRRGVRQAARRPRARLAQSAAVGLRAARRASPRCRSGTVVDARKGSLAMQSTVDGRRIGAGGRTPVGHARGGHLPDPPAEARAGRADEDPDRPRAPERARRRGGVRAHRRLRPDQGPRAQHGPQPHGGTEKGLFRIVGAAGISTATDATWVTQDRCDGTRTDVGKGRGRVLDRATRKTVTVRVGPLVPGQGEAVRGEAGGMRLALAAAWWRCWSPPRRARSRRPRRHVRDTSPTRITDSGATFSGECGADRDREGRARRRPVPATWSARYPYITFDAAAGARRAVRAAAGRRRAPHSRPAAADVRRRDASGVTGTAAGRPCVLAAPGIDSRRRRSGHRFDATRWTSTTSSFSTTADQPDTQIGAGPPFTLTTQPPARRQRSSASSTAPLVTPCTSPFSPAGPRARHAHAQRVRDRRLRPRDATPATTTFTVAAPPVAVDTRRRRRARRQRQLPRRGQRRPGRRRRRRRRRRLRAAPARQRPAGRGRDRGRARRSRARCSSSSRRACPSRPAASSRSRASRRCRSARPSTPARARSSWTPPPTASPPPTAAPSASRPGSRPACSRSSRQRAKKGVAKKTAIATDIGLLSPPGAEAALRRAAREGHRPLGLDGRQGPLPHARRREHRHRAQRHLHHHRPLRRHGHRGRPRPRHARGQGLQEARGRPARAAPTWRRRSSSGAQGPPDSGRLEAVGRPTRSRARCSAASLTPTDVLERARPWKFGRAPSRRRRRTPSLTSSERRAQLLRARPRAPASSTARGARRRRSGASPGRPRSARRPAARRPARPSRRRRRRRRGSRARSARRRRRR